MSKISFRIKTTYTSIENIFIDEYMPKAPAPLYSLVYSYGLRFACAGIQVDNKEIAEKFSVIESDVVNAWLLIALSYFEGQFLLYYHPRT